jgi:hypothetical protein
MLPVHVRKLYIAPPVSAAQKLLEAGGRVACSRKASAKFFGFANEWPQQFALRQSRREALRLADR